MSSFLVIRDPHVLYRYPRTGITQYGLDLTELSRLFRRRWRDARTFTLIPYLDPHARLQSQRLSDCGGENDLTFGGHYHAAHRCFQCINWEGFLPPAALCAPMD